ncbi:MAG: sulfite exporter TauE/SafE family protein [Nitrospirota bacterium]
MEWLIVYVAVGAAAGLLAGLLGVGGGVVVVPCLAFAFWAQGMADRVVMPLALGTSLAAIVFTASASVRAHHGRGAVRWPLVRALAPGLAVGAWGGAWGATRLSSATLTAVFAGFLWVVATSLVRDPSPRPARELPGTGSLVAVGGVIGFVSGVVGIGGGTLSVPYLLRHRVPIHHAIGTAAAAGLPIAAAGAAGYVMAGYWADGLPSQSAGFVHLPALAGVAVSSMLTAPLGAGLAHRMPTDRLKIVFAGLLYVVGAKLAWSTWSP